MGTYNGKKIMKYGENYIFKRYKKQEEDKEEGGDNTGGGNDGNEDINPKVKTHYVSLGDSIAAGHAIDSQWINDYGEGSQYGKNGNTSTTIVPNSYTDLIKKELEVIYKENIVTASSFARSGDTVEDLLEKLSHDVVRNSIKDANFVTVCIGANNVLQPALSNIDEYINTGNLSTIEKLVETNLAILNNNEDPMSYKALFDKFSEINPDAKYVFTTIYNPYKYLWIDEGSNGFFEPLLSTIPDMNILGFDIDSIIKNSLLDTAIIKQLYSRINGLSDWTENYVTRLNNVLKTKIANYKNINPNFYVADTKTLFESFPDRAVNAQKHYNDLVNVEYTRNYDVKKMDWGRMYEGSNAVVFWTQLATKYVSLSGLNIEGLASEFVNVMIEKVILPDIDPHPESFGHYVLKYSFEDILGWKSLDHYSITFNPNGGTGTMPNQSIVGIDGMPAYVNINPQLFNPVTGYYFANWNTQADGKGISYSNKQLIAINSDITLYAQWSNIYAVTYKHSNHTNLYTDNETGHMECYELYINGSLMPKFGTFASGSSTVYYLPYGTTIRVRVSNYNPSELIYDDATCDVYWNGISVSNGYRGTEYTFTLTGNVTIDFRWKIAGSVATFNAKSWEDCYITTN